MIVSCLASSPNQVQYPDGHNTQPVDSCDDIETCPCLSINDFTSCQDRSDCVSIMSINIPVEFLFCQEPDYCTQHTELVPCEQDTFCGGTYDDMNNFIDCELLLNIIKPGTCIYGNVQLDKDESFTDTDGCTVHTCIEGRSVRTDRSAC